MTLMKKRGVIELPVSRDNREVIVPNLALLSAHAEREPSGTVRRLSRRCLFDGSGLTRSSILPKGDAALCVLFGGEWRQSMPAATPRIAPCQRSRVFLFRSILLLRPV